MGGGEGVNSRQDQRRTGKKISGAEYIVTYCYCLGRLGMSQRWDWHLNFVQCERGDFASGKGF